MQYQSSRGLLSAGWGWCKEGEGDKEGGREGGREGRREGGREGGRERGTDEMDEESFSCGISRR